MISLDEVRRLMEDKTLSDEEASAIRDACYELSGIVIEQWIAERAESDRERAGPAGGQAAGSDSQ